MYNILKSNTVYESTILNETSNNVYYYLRKYRNKLLFYLYT